MTHSNYRSVGIYVKGNTCYIEEAGENEDWLICFRGEAYKAPLADAEEVGRLILHALDRYRRGVPCGVLRKPLPILELSGYRKLDSFMNGTMNVHLMETSGRIAVAPSKKVRGGFDPMDETLVRYPSHDPREIGEAVQWAAELCE